MHVKHQMENMVPRKADMQSWGTFRYRQYPSNSVKLPIIHRRLTRQKTRMDNLSLRRNALAHFGKKACATGFYMGLEKRLEGSGYRIDRALNDNHR